MKKACCIIFILFSLLPLPAQSDDGKPAFTEDSFRFSRKNYKRTYKIIIRDKQSHEFQGYLFKLSQHTITISNISPRSIDSLSQPSLILTTFIDTTILEIEIVRKKAAANALLLPLIPAALAGYYVKRESDTAPYPELATIFGVFIGIAIYSVVVLPSAIIASVKHIYEVNFDHETYMRSLLFIQQKTTYKIYEH